MNVTSDTPPVIVTPGLEKTFVVPVNPVGGPSVFVLSNDPPVSAGRFDLGMELARGGTAVVYVARDRDLDRDVAVKILLAEHSGRPDLIERFQDEAKVMARLQHPGIPPVHAVGWLGDGRPFIAMKLIRGRTLYYLLLEKSSDPLASFLPAFEQVCQALGYAHSQGVIHRDLKPGNIMIGAFGEAQVMDWGLAKVIGVVGKTPAFGCGPHPRPNGPPHITEVGSLLGTPGYMPPEQARGDVQQIDRRADVFALGAILCEILTGTPPYAGDTTHLGGEAVCGHLADAHSRLNTCAADPGLVRLAVRCLNPDLKERPRDAGELAAALADYRASVDARLRQAERETATVQEQRKKRKVQVALALTLAGLFAAGSAFAWWLEHSERTRTAEKARADRDAEAAATNTRYRIAGELDQAEAELRAKDWAGADAALARADALLQTTGPWNDLADRLGRLKADRLVVAAMDAAEGLGRTWVVNRFDLSAASTAYAEAFRRYGIDLADPAAAGKIWASVVCQRLFSGLEDWYSLDADRPGLVALLDNLDPHAKRSAIRQRYFERNTQALAALAATIDPAELTPSLAVLLAEASKLDPSKTLNLLETVWRSYPRDFLLCIELGNRLGGIPSRRRDAIGYSRAAVAVRPDNAAAWNNLGSQLTDNGFPEDGIACFRKALQIDPKHQYARLNLGRTLLSLKRAAEAEPELMAAAAGDPNDPFPLLLLEEMYRKAGRTKDLLSIYPKMVAAAGPTVANKKSSVSTLYDLGTALLRSRNNNVESELCLQRAVKLQPEWPEARINLGLAIQRQGRYAEALDLIKSGHELGIKKKDWAYPSAQWLVEAEALANQGSREIAPPPRRIE